MAEQEEDYSSLALETRATHKIWKVRLAAYEEMKISFTKSGHESDICFRPFLDDPSIFKKIVTDSNVVAQEAGLAALVSFLEFGGSQCCLRLRSQVVGPMVEKTMGSARSGTKQNALNALLFFIELDTADPVIDEIMPALSHRTPKLVAGTAHALTEIIKAYGAKTVSCKPLFKVLPALFSHADKNVRAEAQGLTIELYKWLGDGFKESLFPDLKPVQQKDLEAEFERVKGTAPKQERFLKSQREAMERMQASGIDSGSGGGQASGTVDDEDDDVEMDLFDPVEVLSKIPADFDKRVGSTKWKERKEVLEEAFTIINVPRIEDAEYGDIVRLLAKCMKDANIQVVVVAGNIIEALAKGLRTSFAKYQSIVLSPILERLKEKKTTISEALGKALDAIFNTTSLSDIVEETVGFLKHKTPQVRIETAKFLSRCLQTTKTVPKPNEIKLIIEAGIVLQSDTQEPVRTEAAQILGIMMKIIGERAMNPFLDGVDDIKKGKIKEFYETAQIKAKPGKAAPATASAPAPSPVASRPAAASKAPPGGRPLLRKKLSPGSSTTAPPARPAAAEPAAAVARPKPGPPSAAARRPGGLLSPIKTRSEAPPVSSLHEQLSPTSATAPSAAPGAPPARAGLTGRGLTGRPIASQTRQGFGAPPGGSGHALGVVDSGISAQERQELEKLRAENQELQKEREHLQWQVQGFNAEKMALMQEINNLQFKNAQLVDEHTRDVVSIKSKETQLIRAQSDLVATRDQLSMLKREHEVLQRRLEFGGSNGSQLAPTQRHSFLDSPRRKTPAARPMPPAAQHQFNFTETREDAGVSTEDAMDVDYPAHAYATTTPGSIAVPATGPSGTGGLGGSNRNSRLQFGRPMAVSASGPPPSAPLPLPQHGGGGGHARTQSGLPGRAEVAGVHHASNNRHSYIGHSSSGEGFGLESGSSNISDWKRESKRTELLKDRLKQIQELQQRSEERKRMKEELGRSQ